MTHVRQQIREAAAAALDGQTDAEGDVFDSLVFPKQAEDLPLIYIRTDTESSELISAGASQVRRELELVVTAVASETDQRALSNTLDQFAADIEAVIGDNSLGGLLKWNSLTSTEVTRDSGGSRAAAEISLTFTVIYVTSATDGETAQ